MSLNTDIVGIVRELKQSCDCGDSWHLGKNDRKKIFDNFPAIAESLLMAVDALNIAAGCPKHCQGCQLRINEAFSQIKSLPLSK